MILEFPGKKRSKAVKKPSKGGIVLSEIELFWAKSKAMRMPQKP
jgi:hypothetical protein